jgi:hypothetical protein
MNSCHIMLVCLLELFISKTSVCKEHSYKQIEANCVHSNILEKNAMLLSLNLSYSKGFVFN